MFKSVFAKYLAVFMLLITFSFLILALIISSIANDYAINTKRETITRTSESIVNFLIGDFEGDDSIQFTKYLKTEPKPPPINMAITLNIYTFQKSIQNFFSILNHFATMMFSLHSFQTIS